DALWIARDSGRQHLHGDLSMESCIAGAIHFTHSTGIQGLDDAVRSEFKADAQSRSYVLRGQRIRGDQRVDRRTLRKTSGLSVRREQRFHFTPKHDVIATSLAQEIRSLVWRAHQRRVKDLLNPVPPIRVIDHCATRPLVIRRYSHARADCHSREIVARDRDNTPAISSSESPPKYFNSTMCA